MSWLDLVETERWLEHGMEPYRSGDQQKCSNPVLLRTTNSTIVTWSPVPLHCPVAAGVFSGVRDNRKTFGRSEFVASWSERACMPWQQGF
jgi:hypothetical protein